MVLNLVWHVIWRYVDGNGNLLPYPEQAADFIVTPLIGADYTARPDPNDLKTRIGNNFATPLGATIAIRLISSAQTPAVYS